jgi:hypothetical protein
LPNANIVDLVSYGVSNNAEGGATVNNGVALTSTQGAVRKNSGCQDTDNNNNDFTVVAAPTPRNSSSTAVNCTTMPLTLLSFSIAVTDSKVNTQWATTNEVDVALYQVEKSVNGKDFKSIGAVEAKGSLTLNNYSFVDEKVIAGASYYRLKMIDKNGSSKYSAIETVKTKSVGLSVYPNPVKNTITVQHEIAAKGAMVSVMTVAGKPVFQSAVDAGATQTSIDAAKLAPGAYLVMFINNGVKLTKQFIKE